jgi:hypothetical protein
MWDDVVAVSSLRCDVIAEQREQLGLTKAETARRMFAYLSTQGAGARNGIALTDSGFEVQRRLDDGDLPFSSSEIMPSTATRDVPQPGHDAVPHR